MAFPGFKQLKPGWEKVTTTGKRARWGEDAYMFPGRWFRYAIAGEALTVANLHTHISATDAHDLDLVPAAAVSAGDTTITIASLTTTLNEYADGMLILNDVEEEGHYYLIKGNTAGTSATCTVTIDEEDGFVAALTTSQQMGLVHSMGFDVVVYPTTSLGPPVGATCVDWADNQHGWLQTRGPGVATLHEGTAVLAGNPLGPTTQGTAGELELLDQSGTIDYGIIAWMGDAVGVEDESSAVYWVGI
ncbi:hypothetical protein CMI37_28915 [Candidatus Pacearchaeota archaeon]|nr:hypothetical protein [Candidatus Pacearchaeota archaeon]